MLKPIIDDSMAQLSKNNPNLYQQLKQRQMEYISLIRDLYYENQSLKAQLQQNHLHTQPTNINQNMPIAISSQRGNFANQPIINDRFTFSGKDENIKNSSHLSGNSDAHYKSQKIIINYQSQYPNNPSISNNLSNHYPPNQGPPVKQTNNDVRSGNICSVQVIKKTKQKQQQEKVGITQNIWQIKTNKSIHRDESGYNQYKKENQFDHSSIGSSNQIINKAVGQKNSVYKSEESTFQYHSSMLSSPRFQGIPRSHSKSNEKVWVKSAQQLFSRRSRPNISNKVYL